MVQQHKQQRQQQYSSSSASGQLISQNTIPRANAASVIPTSINNHVSMMRTIQQHGDTGMVSTANAALQSMQSAANSHHVSMMTTNQQMQQILGKQESEHKKLRSNRISTMVSSCYLDIILGQQ